MDTLTVRLYDVRFGDAILVSVPDKDDQDQPLTRHILIDVGNVTAGEGGKNEVFEPVIQDILTRLGGQPLDLYVMTHEHMDHVQGLLWAERKAFPNESLRDRLAARHSWLPASAHPDYYDTHPEAKKKLVEARETYLAIERHLAASDEPPAEALQVLMQNNNRFLPAAADAPGLSHGRTADCVQYLRSLAGANTHYVHRSVGQGGELYDLAGKHPFREAQFEIWAPEEDSSDYYGRFQPMALEGGAQGVAAGDEASLTPPEGVDAGAFYNLVERRRRGFVDNLLAIDKAANNSSVVFCLEWRGWRLLFTGDAELRSWKEMNKEGTLSPVHFLKIGHHGSHNGTPAAELLHKIFPMPVADGKVRRAAVSTFHHTYNGIPHLETFDELSQSFACEVTSTLEDVAPGELALRLDFPG